MLGIFCRLYEDKALGILAVNNGVCDDKAEVYPSLHAGGGGGGGGGGAWKLRKLGITVLHK